MGDVVKTNKNTILSDTIISNRAFLLTRILAFMLSTCNIGNTSTNISFQLCMILVVQRFLKGIEHVPNMFMSFDKYLILEVINILI